MASAKKRKPAAKKKKVTAPAEPAPAVPSWEENPPPGATRRAFDREDNGGVTPGSPLGDRHAAGTPAGGDATGGLAGSNIDDGTPVEPDEVPRDEDGPYAGPSGGAVGGTPAEGRASGGHVYQHEITPGASPHRGDSTIGADPSKGT
jgi:hypothetical protein